MRLGPKLVEGTDQWEGSKRGGTTREVGPMAAGEREREKEKGQTRREGFASLSLSFPLRLLSLALFVAAEREVESAIAKPPWPQR